VRIAGQERKVAFAAMALPFSDAFRPPQDPASCVLD